MEKIKLFLVLISAISSVVNTSENDEIGAGNYVDEVCEVIRKMSYETAIASWNYESNITDYNKIKNSEEMEKFAEYTKNVAQKLMKFDCKLYTNETLKRLIKKLANVDDEILSVEDYHELNDVIAKMQSNYAKVKIPSFKDKSKMFQLEPEITEVLVKSTDPKELEYYWTNWYNLAGTPCKADFFKYARLKNKAAQLNHFEDAADAWLDFYEDPTFEQQILEILEKIKPIYQQLHGYVRHKLHEFYGSEHVKLDKPIPMHLLGNIWGQKFDIGDKIKPFKNAQKIDITPELLSQGYTAKKLFESAEEFFVSLNMTKMPEKFWKNSIIEKPNDGRDIICHASAWDFYIEDDVRIKQCTRVSMESFITIHHEMGHVEYYLQYKNKPAPFRRGANPGFHEAIGDTIALSVTTPKHLHRVGLLKETSEDFESLINYQFEMGTTKLAFLPFAYVMDKFRYDVFRGNVEAENANCHFWRLREKYGGIGPASKRSNRDFDITAKYHASADVEYMRYVVSNIIQFQFHKAACIKAGEYEPNNPAKTLHNCDIYNSANAGNAIKEMLALGSSKPWPDVLECLTGERVLSADAILEYFKPLSKWLEETNKKLGVKIGWESSDNLDCPPE